MNKYELNQADLNGSYTHNVIVELGTASATIEFVAFERALAFLSGTAGISASVLGDITKYSQIGYAGSGIVFSHIASLAAFTEVNIPSGTADISFSEYGELYSQLLLPAAASGIDFSSSGDLYVVGDLAGTAGLTFSVTSDSGPQLTKLLGTGTASFALDGTADLTQYIIRYIPAADTALEFEADGALTQHVKQYLPTSSSPMTFDVVGNLTNYAKVYLSGESGVAFSETAGLQSTVRMPISISGIDFTTTAVINNRRIDIPTANTGIVFGETAYLAAGVRSAIPFATLSVVLDTTGSLTKKANLGTAIASFTLTTEGHVGNIQKLQGASVITFTTSANLLNNPTAIDPPAYVLTRPFVDRIMVRQS